MSLINLTVGELLEEQVNLYPDQEAVIYPELELRKTYKEFNEMVDDTAKTLMKLVVQKGEHIGIWAVNQPEWSTKKTDVGKRCAALVTVNTKYQSNELG